jgi:hypothetical protein
MVAGSRESKHEKHRIYCHNFIESEGFCIEFVLLPAITMFKSSILAEEFV